MARDIHIQIGSSEKIHTRIIPCQSSQRTMFKPQAYQAQRR